VWWGLLCEVRDVELLAEMDEGTEAPLAGVEGPLWPGERGVAALWPPELEVESSES